MPPTRHSQPFSRICVPRDDWLEVLAGDNPNLRATDGTPMITVISAAAGLDPSALTQIVRQKNRMGLKVQDALINFLEDTRQFTEDEARKALFMRVESPQPQQAVAA